MPTPPTTRTQVKAEPVSPPHHVDEAEKSASAMPASTNSVDTASATAAIASSSLFAAIAALPSPAAPSGSAPVDDSVPTKRSRSYEASDQDRDEKRQKMEHVEETQATNIDDLEAEGEPEPEPGIESSNFLSWDLGAQLSSVLGSVEPESGKDINGTIEDTSVDIMPPIPLLPPPRKRPEKMKFIENPTYFSRAMGLPMLGSLVR